MSSADVEGGQMTNVAGTVLHGHKLRGEGAPYNESGAPVRIASWSVGGEGRAKCECGDLSEVLPSAAARKRWHRLHKGDIRANNQLR